MENIAYFTPQERIEVLDIVKLLIVKYKSLLSPSDVNHIDRDDCTRPQHAVGVSALQRVP